MYCTCVIPLAAWPSPPPTAQRSSTPPTILPPPLNSWFCQMILRGSNLRQCSIGSNQLAVASKFSVFAQVLLKILLTSESPQGEKEGWPGLPGSPSGIRLAIHQLTRRVSPTTAFNLPYNITRVKFEMKLPGRRPSSFLHRL